MLAYSTCYRFGYSPISPYERSYRGFAKCPYLDRSGRAAYNRYPLVREHSLCPHTQKAAFLVGLTAAWGRYAWRHVSISGPIFEKWYDDQRSLRTHPSRQEAAFCMTQSLLADDMPGVTCPNRTCITQDNDVKGHLCPTLPKWSITTVYLVLWLSRVQHSMICVALTRNDRL